MTGKDYADTHILGNSVAIMHCEQSFAALVHDWVLKWPDHAIRVGCA
jgi:hypothetical protein